MSPPCRAMFATTFQVGLFLGLFFHPAGEGVVFHRNVGSRSTEFMELYPRRQNSSLLMSAYTYTTQGSTTLNMTYGVTVEADNALPIHTQIPGSRRKISSLCSASIRFESQPEHGLHCLQPFVIFLSISRDSAFVIATATGWTTQSSGFEFR
jgi:hypothetical protein